MNWYDITFVMVWLVPESLQSYATLHITLEQRVHFGGNLPRLHAIVSLEGQNVLSCESPVSWDSCVMYTAGEYL